MNSYGFIIKACKPASLYYLRFFFSNWLLNRNTIEFLGIWEQLMNMHFNCAEFDIIKS